MKFDKLLKAIATLDKPQLRQISDAVLEHHRYLNHDPLVYGVKRRMADHTVHYRVTDPIAVWGEGVHYPRLWLVPDLEVAKTEAIIRGLSSRWSDITYEMFSIPKAEAILLPCYKILKYDQQKVIEVKYKNIALGEQRIDFLVENEVIVELKASSEINEAHKAQVLSYLKAAKKRVGLILNFAKEILEIKRIVNKY